MKWRHLRRGEFDHELVWLSVSFGIAALGATWLSLGLPWPRCGFRALFGIPCFTCGATRSAIAFVHGNFGLAWQHNPLVSLAIWAIAAFDVYAIAVLISRAPRLRFNLPKRWTPLVVAAVIAAGLNWLWVLRNG